MITQAEQSALSCGLKPGIRLISQETEAARTSASKHEAIRVVQPWWKAPGLAKTPLEVELVHSSRWDLCRAADTATDHCNISSTFRWALCRRAPACCIRFLASGGARYFRGFSSQDHPQVTSLRQADSGQTQRRLEQKGTE